MKKLLPILVVLLIVVALLFTGQEEVEEDAPATAGVRQVSLYHYLSGTLRGGMGDMVETVNQRQKEYRVTAEALDHEAFKSMIPTMLEQGMPPDMFTYWAGAKTQELVDQGRLEPIDDLWQDLSVSRRFARSVVDSAVSYGGRRYLLPITQHAVVFFYNRQVFQRANLAPPRNWQQLMEAAGQLKAEGITPFALGAKERWPAQFWFDYLLLRTAGPQFRRELMAGDHPYTAPEVQKAFRIWADLLERGFFNATAGVMDWAEATQLVCKGEAAATLMGTWAIQYLTGPECGLAEEQDFDFFIFPEIDPTVQGVVVGPIDGLVLSRDSASHEFAKKVLAFFSEAEPQKIMSVGSGAFAPSLEINRDVYSALRRRILAEVERAPHWAFNYDLATTSARADKGLDSFAELIEFPGRYQAILENLETEISLRGQRAGAAE
ncbi:MAG: extracellular solute-binding protein [Desulfobulbaceae bacterium]|nr:MAG: extracellular solute-binding protein [Desulfobulbaceae bacterium]